MFCVHGACCDLLRLSGQQTVLGDSMGDVQWGNVADGRCSHCTGFWNWLRFGSETWSPPITRVDVMSSVRRYQLPTMGMEFDKS